MHSPTLAMMNRPSKSNDTAELHVAAHSIIEHLRCESAYLESVIQCSLTIKDLLLTPRRQPPRPLNERSNSESTPNNPTSTTLVDAEQERPTDAANDHGQLISMRDELARQFLPIQQGRRQLQSTLQRLEKISDAMPTLRQLASRLDAPLQYELKQLRLTIKSKLQEIQAIAMGNQTVMIYTLDFYERLMSGITGQSPPASSYNATGQMTNGGANRIVEKRV